MTSTNLEHTAIEKQNRVDLKTRNAGGEIVLIEVQYQRQFDDLQRILHSTARTVVENLQEGQQQERLRIARSLLDVIADDKLLAEKTGLSEADVQSLRG